MSWIDFIHGNQHAFESIYREYIDELFAFGIKFHSDKDTVLDCIHDLFVSLYNNPNIAKDVHVKHYLFSSLRRRLLRVKEDGDKYSDLRIEDIVNVGTNVEIEWIKTEKLATDVERVKVQIEKLPKRQREVLFLKYFAEFSYDEIAAIMNVNVTTCRTLSYRAIKQLKNQLQPLLLILSLTIIW